MAKWLLSPFQGEVPLRTKGRDGVPPAPPPPHQRPLVLLLDASMVVRL